MSSSLEEVGVIRRSERTVKHKRAFSPEPANKNKKNLKTNRKLQKTSREVELIKHPSGRTFCCDRCKAPLVHNPFRQLQKRCTGSPLLPKHRVDPVSNQVLTLCNACGMSLSYQRKPRREKIAPTAIEKEKYLQEAQTFAVSLVEVLQDADAERLFCPEFKTTPCACLQKFVLSDGSLEDSQKRAMLLLQLLKEAKRLSQQKCYNIEQTQLSSGKGHKTRNIGLGNGQKRSREFEFFVLNRRRYLRDELQLCERATQRVLMYSNNFLHKKLKTEPQRGSRVQRKKGKSALGLLKPIPEMATEACCIDNCVLMAITHSALLHRWRERAAIGQAEARRVLAEMLTPCGGGRSNCYKFISVVTGCSHSTISKVNEQMKRTGGEREPPEHGLKKWWQEQAKRNVSPSGQKDSDLVYTRKSPDTSELDVDNVRSIPLTAEVDDSLGSDTSLEPQIRTRENISELQRHILDLQQESLIDDPMFPLNNNSQVVLKLSSNPRLCNILRIRKNPTLLTDDADEILLGTNGSELPASLFLSPTCLLPRENCQDKVIDNTSRNTQQTISHLVLDELSAENLLSSGLVINIMQSSKAIQEGTEGRQSSVLDDASCSLIGDLSLLQTHADSSGNAFLTPVTFGQKTSLKPHQSNL